MIGRIVLQLLLIGVLFTGGITLFQDRLLYFPDAIALPALLTDAKRDGLRAWPAEGEFRGLVRDSKGPARGTLVLFHGNAGHAGHRAAYAELAQHGLRVILAEYPGYGPRPGQPGEAALAADAAATVALAHREFPGPLLLAGESLGAAVAAAAYARAPEAVSALWLITPWDRIASVAGHHYPWLPVDWLLRDRYDSLAHIADARIPVAVTVAERDTIVPARYGRALYDGLRAPKRLWLVPGADHNDWMDHVDAGWWAEVVGYLLRPLPEAGGAIPNGGKAL